MDASPPDPEGSGTDPAHRMPGWVRAFVIVGIVLVLVVVAALLSSGGHGPRQHTAGGGQAEVQPPQGHQPPSGTDH